MPGKAPRHPTRLREACARGAALAFGIWLTGGAALAEWHPGPQILGAEYTEPTTRYAHGVLGDAVEWGGLRIRFPRPNAEPKAVEFTLPQDHVFEDLAPRLVDLDLDGEIDAVLVIESDATKGAALALYGTGGKITETPHIGTRNRWLAPLGAADLDGDGHVELAYIDRPHLAKTLRIWRFQDSKLKPIADQPGLTNHRIGEDFISGGIRDCGQGPEIVTVNANWSRVVVSRLQDGRITTRDIGAFPGRAGLARIVTCN
jgi:hypothetical protein